MGVLPEYEEEIFAERADVNVESTIKPYSEIPGPKELPIIGNAWRFAPVIGNFYEKKSFWNPKLKRK